jgi:tetratricopeptide (TPR) repeat protein
MLILSIHARAASGCEEQPKRSQPAVAAMNNSPVPKRIRSLTFIIMMMKCGLKPHNICAFPIGRFLILSNLILAGMVLETRDAYADSLNSGLDRKVLSEIVYHVFTDDYDSAYTLCHEVIETSPGNPAGYFFKAYTMMAQMTEEQADLYNKAYFSLLDTVELLATNISDTCPNDCKAWCYWYIGNIWAYRSLWKARFGSFISAYKLSTKARESYEKGLQYDSTLFDLYAGLGAVHYWKSAKGGILRIFGVLKDDREKGIAELKRAAESSVLSRETARKTLITILNDYKQYDSALAYANEMLGSYPNGRSFLWGISWAHFFKKDYYKAHDFFLQLRRRLAESPGNYSKLIECDAQIARCLAKLGRNEQARDWCSQNALYLQSVSADIRNSQKANIDYLTKMSRP